MPDTKVIRKYVNDVMKKKVTINPLFKHSNCIIKLLFQEIIKKNVLAINAECFYCVCT